MPGGDGTGPAGLGPMTGRAAGYCAGYSVPGFMNPIPGRGFWGWGRGRGWGWRNWFYATGLTGWQRAAVGWPYPGGYAGPFAPTASKEQQLEVLKGQAEYLQDALDGINKRIEELQAQSEKRQAGAAYGPGAAPVRRFFRKEFIDEDSHHCNRAFTGRVGRTAVRPMSVFSHR